MLIDTAAVRPYLTSKSAWVLPKEDSCIAPSDVYSNRDMDPTPSEQRLWTAWTFFAYWISDLVNPGSFATAAANVVALGLTWWEVCLAVFVGKVLVAIIITANGIIGAKLHTPFAITSRSVYENGGAKPVAKERITGRPEIDRTDLRNLLLNSLQSGTIKWDHALVSARALDNSTYELTFTDRPPITTSYLIGADGTFSRIRPLLHSNLPTYSGISMYDMLIPASSMTPSRQQTVGDGGAMILGDHKGLLAQMNSGGKCRVYASLQCDEKFIDENPLPATGKLDWVKGLYEGWANEFLDLIEACNEDDIVPRRIWEFDPNLQWKTELTGVTLMGDAAHVMSPFAGEGVNQGLADALDLGKTIVNLFIAPSPTLLPFPITLVPFHLSTKPTPNPTIVPPPPQILHAALRKYEKSMMARVKPYNIEASRNSKICFGDDAARKFNSLFLWMIAGAVGKMVLYSPWYFLRSFWSNDE